AAHVAGVLDRDAVVQQRLADRRAGRGAHLGALGAVFGVGEYLDDGHVARGCRRPRPAWVQTVSMFLPARAWWMPRFMRIAAKASVPLASLSLAASSSLGSVSERACPASCSRPSM